MTCYMFFAEVFIQSGIQDRLYINKELAKYLKLYELKHLSSLSYFVVVVVFVFLVKLF